MRSASTVTQGQLLESGGGFGEQDRVEIVIRPVRNGARDRFEAERRELVKHPAVDLAAARGCGAERRRCAGRRLGGLCPGRRRDPRRSGSH
jgi:hypothetical protein